MKICSVCKEVKPLSEFYSFKYGKNGLQASCKPCFKVQVKRYQFRVKYGITIEQYEDMLEDQHFECAICHIDVSEVTKEFAVDHDHDTNRVRGLLCDLCNRGLGYFKHNTVSMQNAITYLEGEI